MAQSNTIVCLANSRKHSGRCIAGKEILPHGYGGWIRPVGGRLSTEIWEEDRRYENGVMPKVLDIIEIPMVEAAPHLHQSENYLIDPEYYWVKKGQLLWPDVKRLVDPPGPLWIDGDSSSGGVNDRVTLAIAAKLKQSLVLIAPDELKIKVGTPSGTRRRRVRADFRHFGSPYSLIVTDPVAESLFLAKNDGDYKLTEAYLCVSLSEPYTDCCCYKLVATVIGDPSL